MEFLRLYFKEVYVQTCSYYSEVMARVYYASIKTYTYALNNKMVDIYTK